MADSRTLLPDVCFRGLSSKDWITAGGYITSAAFQFGQYCPDERGDDGFCELSIQWKDDENAEKHLLEQRNSKTEELQFKAGYCKIDIAQLKLVVKQYIREKTFSMERRPIEEDFEKGIKSNPYHGNLLLHNSIERQVKKNIEHMIAGIIEREDVFLRDDNKLIKEVTVCEAE